MPKCHQSVYGMSSGTRFQKDAPEKTPWPDLDLREFKSLETGELEILQNLETPRRTGATFAHMWELEFQFLRTEDSAPGHHEQDWPKTL